MLAASFVYYQDMIRWVEEFKVLTTTNPIVEERPTMEK
jgi:hypothetical protein